MRRRFIAAVAAAGMTLVAVPAGSHAEEVDTTCRNGNEPVHFQTTNLSPIVKLDVRLLCIRD